MSRSILVAIALAIGFILGSFTSSRLTAVRAQAPPKPVSTMAVPTYWGALRGVSDKYLVFEDSNGKIHLAYIESGLQSYIDVTRQ